MADLRQVEAGGTRLAYLERGAGETVVFVHGAVSDFRTWLPQVEALSERYRVISYSRRYHYPNAWEADAPGYSRALHAADLAAFVRALGAGPVHLVGHSYGAALAVLVARERPELVRSMVLGEPSPFRALLGAAGESLIAAQEVAFHEAIRLAEGGEEAGAVRVFLKTVVGADVFDGLPPAARAVVMDNARTLGPMLKTYYVTPPFGCDDARRISTRTLLVTGELSPRISRLNDERLHACLPNAWGVTLAGASHGLQIEQPLEFNRVALEFLAEHSSNS